MNPLCLPDLQLRPIRESVYLGCKDDRCDFIVKEDRGIEGMVYRLLEGDEITPRLLGSMECDGKKIIITEKYDGNFDQLMSINLDRLDLLSQLFQIIARLSLKLNLQYRIRHGDFHSENIVYKVVDGWLFLRLIDFELSTFNDENPYYDLLTLENSLGTVNVRFEIPEETREEYYSSLTEADRELYMENLQMKSGLPLLTIPLN